MVTFPSICERSLALPSLYNCAILSGDKSVIMGDVPPGDEGVIIGKSIT